MGDSDTWPRGLRLILKQLPLLLACCAGLASLRPVRSASRQPLAGRSWLRPSAAAAAAAPEVDQLEVLLLRLEEGRHQLGGYIQRLEVGQQQLGQRMQHLEAGQQQLEDGLQRVRQAEERLRGLISRGPLARANKGEEEVRWESNRTPISTSFHKTGPQAAQGSARLRCMPGARWRSPHAHS